MAISISDALNIIYKKVTTKSTHIVPIEEALGAIVAKDYEAIFDLPKI